MKDIIPNSDNGVISSFYREGNSCFPACKHPEKYYVSCDREYEWFPTVIFDHYSYANFRTGSMSLSSATSNTHTWIFRLILSWASTWNWWSRYGVRHRRLSCAFFRRTRVSSGDVAKSCYATLSGIASGNKYNVKEHCWTLYLIPKIPELELILSYFTERLGVSNASSTLILLHNQIIHIATSHRV
jgi:hypothetical protein